MSYPSFSLRLTCNNSAGELTQEKLEEVIAIVSNPKAFKIPDWFLNRQRDWKTGKSSQATSNVVDTKLREDLERLKKVRYVAKSKMTVLCDVCGVWVVALLLSVEVGSSNAMYTHPTQPQTAPTVVSATTGACACVGSTLRPRAVAARRSGPLARSKGTDEELRSMGAAAAAA